MIGEFWRQFNSLLPAEPRQVGTVVALLGGGRYMVSLFGGATILVRGDGYVVNDKVFITAGVIESKAPSLATVVIDV